MGNLCKDRNYWQTPRIWSKTYQTQGQEGGTIIWLGKCYTLKSNLLILSLDLHPNRHKGSKPNLNPNSNPILRQILANVDPNLPPKEKTHLHHHLTLSFLDPTKKPKKQPPSNPKPSNPRTTQMRKVPNFKFELESQPHQNGQPLRLSILRHGKQTRTGRYHPTPAPTLMGNPRIDQARVRIWVVPNFFKWGRVCTYPPRTRIPPRQYNY